VMKRGAWASCPPSAPSVVQASCLRGLDGCGKGEGQQDAAPTLQGKRHFNHRTHGIHGEEGAIQSGWWRKERGHLGHFGKKNTKSQTAKIDLVDLE